MGNFLTYNLFSLSYDIPMIICELSLPYPRYSLPDTSTTSASNVSTDIVRVNVNKQITLRKSENGLLIAHRYGQRLLYRLMLKRWKWKTSGLRKKSTG